MKRHTPSEPAPLWWFGLTFGLFWVACSRMKAPTSESDELIARLDQLSDLGVPYSSLQGTTV